MPRPSLPSLSRLFPALVLLSCMPVLVSQEAAPPLRHEVYVGYTWLSNSFNGVPGARQSLNGWDASLALGYWHGLRFKAETFSYRGTNLGAPQQPMFIMGGGQYGHRLGRETVFVEGLAGDVGMNRNWGANQSAGETASFATLLGGGIDVPLSRHFAARAGAGFIYENIALQGPRPDIVPYRVPGLPNFFARLSTGMVWRF
ncbi:hypothetical protein DYQ86_02675 [Acidobacteria bacterium AB60]|nr:hypothetical protein DYQ86_02675 [Acidobacteria bacterium AB60]